MEGRRHAEAQRFWRQSGDDVSPSVIDNITTDQFPRDIVIVVSGGRDFSDQRCLNYVLDQIHKERNIVRLGEGGAKGADTLARTWAIARGVPYHTIDADWEQFGPAAGAIRNGELLRHLRPKLLVAFPTGGPGTRDMIDQAAALDIETIIIQAKKRA